MPKRAKEATVGYLERVALWYLGRYPGSVAGVRRALERRVALSVQQLGTSPEEGARAAGEVIAKLLRSGLLDDDRFAASRVASFRERGLSRRMIEHKLRAHGLDSGRIDRALAGAEGDDLESAKIFVRKRRLGPHRRSLTGDERTLRAKELAKLARAGFSYQTAVLALAGPSSSD